MKLQYLLNKFVVRPSAHALLAFAKNIHNIGEFLHGDMLHQDLVCFKGKFKWN